MDRTIKKYWSARRFIIRIGYTRAEIFLCALGLSILLATSHARAEYSAVEDTEEIPELADTALDGEAEVLSNQPIKTKPIKSVEIKGDVKSDRGGDRKSWIQEYCSHAVRDPKCQSHLSKQMHSYIRKLQSNDKTQGAVTKKLDESCDPIVDGAECQKILKRDDSRYLQQRLSELRRYCQKNPSAERCTLFFQTGAIDEASARSKMADIIKEEEKASKLLPPPTPVEPADKTANSPAEQHSDLFHTSAH